MNPGRRGGSDSESSISSRPTTSITESIQRYVWLKRCWSTLTSVLQLSNEDYQHLRYDLGPHTTMMLKFDWCQISSILTKAMGKHTSSMLRSPSIRKPWRPVLPPGRKTRHGTRLSHCEYTTVNLHSHRAVDWLNYQAMSLMVQSWRFRSTGSTLLGSSAMRTWEKLRWIFSHLARMIVSKLRTSSYCDSLTGIIVTLKLSKYDVKGHLQIRQRSVVFKLRQSTDSTDASNVNEQAIPIEDVSSSIIQVKDLVDQLQSPSWDVLLDKVDWFMKLMSPITGVNISVGYILPQFSLLLASCIPMQRWHGIFCLLYPRLCGLITFSLSIVLNWLVVDYHWPDHTWW
jgi:hypothetical protein